MRRLGNRPSDRDAADETLFASAVVLMLVVVAGLAVVRIDMGFGHHSPRPQRIGNAAQPITRAPVPDVVPSQPSPTPISEMPASNAPSPSRHSAPSPTGTDNTTAANGGADSSSPASRKGSPTPSATHPTVVPPGTTRPVASAIAPAPPAAPKPTAAPVTSVPLTYTIRRGDTLSDIGKWFAERGYGALFAANLNVLLDSPKLIRPGERITLSNAGMILQPPR